MSSLAHPVDHFVSMMVAQLRSEEALLRHRGLVKEADVVGSIATDLEGAAARWLDEPLTLREAADLCGYSVSTLESRVRAGKLANAGEKHRPRVTRRDLPLKSPAKPAGLVSSPSATGDQPSIEELVEREIVVRASTVGDPDLGPR